MQLIISAHACEFERSSDCRVMTYRPLDPPLYRAAFEARNLAELHAELDRVQGLLIAANPAQSFFVCEFRARGDRSRAFSGYNKNQRYLKREYDANARESEAA